MTNQGNRRATRVKAPRSCRRPHRPAPAPQPPLTGLFHDAAVRGLAIFPIIEVPNSFTFTLKLSGTVVASNAVAALIWFQTRPN